MLFRSWPTLFFVLGWGLLSLVQTRPLFLAVSLGSMIVAVWWLRNFFDYYLDAWLITDHGIIDIAWHGWFHRQSARVLYSDIQGVEYEIHGILGTLLYFGTVSVEKISTGAHITLEYVKNPRSVETSILTNMEAYVHSKNLKSATQVQELLATFVAERMQMKEFSSDDEP